MKALEAICETFVPSITLERLSLDGAEVDNAPATAFEPLESLAKGALDDVDAFYKRSASDVGLAVEVCMSIGYSLIRRLTVE